MTRNQATLFRLKLNGIIDALPDDDAFKNVVLYPIWAANKTFYGPNDPDHPQSRVQYNGVLYKCLSTHISQSDWTPDVSVSLWHKIDDPAIEWPPWKQPTGAGTGYPLGAKVSHNGKHWINVGKDDNEYEPGVWGWEEVIQA